MKDTLKYFVIAAVCLSYGVTGSPIPNPHREIPMGKAYINCRDKTLVRRLEKVSVEYSCLPGTNLNSISGSVMEDMSPNSVVGYDEMREPMVDGDSVPECVDPKSCGTEKCSDGYVFDEKKNRCTSETEFRPVAYDGLTEKESTETENILPIVKTGEIVPMVEEQEISPGVEKKVVVGEEEVIPLGRNKDGLSEAEEIVPIADNEEIIKKVECDKGTIFVPEVDLCLPVDPRETIEKPKVESVEIAFVPNGKCPPGTVYSPEVDHCLKVNHHSSNTHTAEEIERLFILSDTNPEALVYEDSNKRSARDIDFKRGVAKDRQDRDLFSKISPAQIGESKCTDAQVYVSEIDLCLDL